MLFISSMIILSLNVFTAQCDQMCDCKEIYIVMDVLLREILELKMVYSGLLAKMQKIEETQKSVAGSGDIQSLGTTDGRWTEWSSWGACSATCGDGVRERSRFCAKSLFSKLPDKSFCGGITEEKEKCNNARCPEDGGWTTWSSWSTCSVTCGDGVFERRRSCTNPPPSENGTKCEGVNKETGSCYIACPAAECDQMCDCKDIDIVKDVLLREILELKKEYSRLLAKMQKIEETQKSVTRSGDIQGSGTTDGGWTNWGSWSSCSVTCGDGVKERKRSCTNPKPSENGTKCDGVNEETGSCHIAPCPHDGGWTHWGSWGSCSVTCGHGFKKRTRSCSNPGASESWKQCLGMNVMILACANNPCTGV